MWAKLALWWWGLDEADRLGISALGGIALLCSGMVLVICGREELFTWIWVRLFLELPLACLFVYLGYSLIKSLDKREK